MWSFRFKMGRGVAIYPNIKNLESQSIGKYFSQYYIAT